MRELLLRRCNELAVEVVANEVDGAAAEAAAHDARTGNTALFGNVVKEVELFAADLVVLRQAFVGLIHQFTDLLVVAFVQGVADSQHTVFLTEHEAGALVVFLANFSTHFVKLFPCAVAQGFELALGMLGLNVLHYVLAGVAAVVVGRTCQLVLDNAVEQYEAIAVGLEGEVFELAATAVEAHEATSLAEDGGELVHDAAVDTAVVVLSGLSGKSHIPLVDLVVAKDVVQTAGEATLHSGAAGHAGTKGNVAGKGDVEALDGYTEFLHLEGDAVDVASPRSAGTSGVVQVEVHTVLQVDGIGHHGVFRAVGAHFGHDAFIDSTGEHETAVVVGVLANEVDTSGRSIYIAGLSIKVLDETASYKINFHHKVYNL